MRLSWLLCGAVALVGSAMPAVAAQIVFSGATATFEQSAGRHYIAAEMIDGVTGGDNGWAIYRNNGNSDQTLNETSLLTLATPLAAGPNDITFTIYQNYGQGHELGDFSLGYTTAASPTLGGAQTAFIITHATSLAGATFTSQASGQLLVGGLLPAVDTYTITAHENSAAAISGFYLNAINDPTNGLPTGGPGRQPANGNFVVSEFVADATPSTTGTVPEPASWALMLGGFGLVGGVLRRRAGPVSVAA